MSATWMYVTLVLLKLQVKIFPKFVSSGRKNMEFHGINIFADTR